MNLLDLIEQATMLVQHVPRGLFHSVVSKRPQMRGTFENPIQIDEARFAGRWKYNCGRLLEGDAQPESEDEDAEVDNARNHGARIDGPWVFGLKQGHDCRYFYIARRDKVTLIPIIKQECELGSYIHSDEWPTYCSLRAKGFEHKTVNHQHNYVDPFTGAHMQGWLETKISILKRKKGVTASTFQSHLNKYCWRMLRQGEPDLFLTFLEDVRVTYT